MKEKRLSSVAGLVGNNIAVRRKQKHMTQARMGELEFRRGRGKGRGYDPGPHG